MAKVEIFIAMNEDGDWIVTDEESGALEKLGEDVGGYQARVVKIIVEMSPPKMDEASVTVPDTAGETTKVAVEG